MGDTPCSEVDLSIKYSIRSKYSALLRSKKQLIENFIDGLNEVDDVMNEWNEFVSEQREKDLDTIIKEERLKPKETREFIENSFRDGEVKTFGTDIDKLMPPISRFGNSKRADKKQTIIDKLKSFFEKYFGIGMMFKSNEQADGLENE